MSSIEAEQRKKNTFVDSQRDERLPAEIKMLSFVSEVHVFQRYILFNKFPKRSFLLTGCCVNVSGWLSGAIFSSQCNSESGTIIAEKKHALLYITTAANTSVSNQMFHSRDGEKYFYMNAIYLEALTPSSLSLLPLLYEILL